MCVGTYIPWHACGVHSLLLLVQGSGTQTWIITLTQSKTPLLDEPFCLPDFYFKIILQKKCNFNIQ